MPSYLTMSMGWQNCIKVYFSMIQAPEKHVMAILQAPKYSGNSPS